LYEYLLLGGSSNADWIYVQMIKDIDLDIECEFKNRICGVMSITLVWIIWFVKLLLFHFIDITVLEA